MYELKTENFALALSPSEREAIRGLARLEGLTQAATVRRLIVLEARRRGVLPSPDERLPKDGRDAA